MITYEYKDSQSFKANRAYLDDTFGKNPDFQKIVHTAKFTTSRCLVVMEV